MANAILVQTKCTAMDVDAYNRTGVATVDVPNGTPLVCGVVSTKEEQKQVFSVTVANAVAKNLWMAYSPEVVITSSSINPLVQFKGTDVDPRNFTNVANIPFDMFKPNPGVDMIQITTPWFKTGSDPKTVTGATYVEIQSDGSMAAVVTPTTNFAGLQFRIIDAEPIIVASGVIGGEQVDAWILECTNN